MSNPAPLFFDAPTGTRIGYYKTEGKSPTVVFMGGLMSDMSGTKALFLEGHCRGRGHGFLRFDYNGHGVSSGKFEDGTIGSWQADALAVIDHLTEGPLMLIGSSMGGWQALLAALARKQRVRGLILLAPAPDFTKKLLLDQMSEAHRAQLLEKGRVEVPSEFGDDPYIFTKNLIEEGNRHLLLDRAIALDIPIRLIHGFLDRDVPFSVSLDIMTALEAPDAELCLVKDGIHNLSRADDLDRLGKTVDEILERIPDAL